MAARLTWRVWPEAALWLTPDFSGQLDSLWATWFFLHFPLFFTASSLCSSLLGLCTSCPPPPPPLSHRGQNAAEQQTQIVAINFRLVYGMGLLAHLLVNSYNRHHFPLLLEQKTTRPQLHPAQHALWTTSMGLQSFYSYTTAFYSSNIQHYLHAPFSSLPLSLI